MKLQYHFFIHLRHFNAVMFSYILLKPFQESLKIVSFLAWPYNELQIKLKGMPIIIQYRMDQLIGIKTTRQNLIHKHIANRLESLC